MRDTTVHEKLSLNAGVKICIISYNLYLVSLFLPFFYSYILCYLLVLSTSGMGTLRSLRHMYSGVMSCTILLIITLLCSYYSIFLIYRECKKQVLMVQTSKILPWNPSCVLRKMNLTKSYRYLEKGLSFSFARDSWALNIFAPNLIDCLDVSGQL